MRDTVTNSPQNLSDDDSEINDDTIIEVHTGTSTDNTDPKYIDTGSEETSCTKWLGLIFKLYRIMTLWIDGEFINRFYICFILS
jgi:hypothetical protein